MNQKTIIQLKNISKSYKVEKNNALCVLDNINLEIKKGSRIGIIAPNGAGKTTLLKIISGVAIPSSGKVETQGKIVSLLDLEAGFEPDLTGRENIYVNGLLAGIKKKTIEQKIEQIIDFAGLNNFIDRPFFTYSSGMKFRLAFSIAIASEADVLIIDEIFQAGDFDYTVKTMKKIKDLQEANPNLTTVVCSHVPIFMWSFASTFYEIDDCHLKPKDKKEVKRELFEHDRKIREIMN